MATKTTKTAKSAKSTAKSTKSNSYGITRNNGKSIYNSTKRAPGVKSVYTSKYNKNGYTYDMKEVHNKQGETRTYTKTDSNGRRVTTRHVIKKDKNGNVKTYNTGIGKNQ